MKPRPDPWESLRAHTPARIALGHAGHGLPTAELLAFQLAHAAARDAIHTPWDVTALRRSLSEIPTVIAATEVPDRPTYLRRPDLGRRLAPASRAALQSLPRCDVVLVVSNGLSSFALEQHGASLIRAIWESWRDMNRGPVVLVPDARVAVSDDVGEALGAKLAVIAIGERPGLSATDSVGLYLTLGPLRGNTDERRNCLSNVRTPHGLGVGEATARLRWLMDEALRRGLSGVALKEEAPEGLLSVVDGERLPEADGDPPSPS